VHDLAEKPLHILFGSCARGEDAMKIRRRDFLKISSAMALSGGLGRSVGAANNTSPSEL
jgi:hypothetical protein